jgi:short-subunit dehydrogenase
MSVIVITGASSGIGRALAIRAARTGYDVVAIGRNRSALATLEEQIGTEYGRVITAALDITDPASAPKIVAMARERFGRLDVLVNNAGQVAVGPLAAQTDAELHTQFDTHVIAPIVLVREALPMLRTSQGQIFLVGSGVARVAIHGLGAYSASKAAVRSAASVLRRELKPEGIAVTYVDPGAVDTAFMTRAGMAGAPPSILVSPHEVARQIMIAVHTRPRVVNAAPWQTAAVALAEAFPQLTDNVLERNPQLVGIAPAPTQVALTTATPALAPAEPIAASAPTAAAPSPAASTDAETAFDAALAPLVRRMERLKLDVWFVRSLLIVGNEIDPNEVALRWAGMPNKNERGLTNEVLAALEAAGFLVANGTGFRVVRAWETVAT